MANLASGVQQYGTNITGSTITLAGSVFAVGDTTIFVLNGSGSFISWQNGRASFLNTLTAIPAYTAFQIRPGGAITTNDAQVSFSTTIASGEATLSPNEYELIAITGQSNATGFGIDTPITTRQPYNNLSFVGGTLFNGTTPGLIALKEGNKQSGNINLDDTTRGESISSAMANFLSALTKRNFFVLNQARDGNSYAGIKKGGSSFGYEALITGVGNAKTQLEATGKTLKIGFAILRHGEADDSVDTPNYDALILEQQTNIETDTKAITGQSGIIPLFICQMNNFTKNNKTTSIVANAQLTAVENNPGKIYGTQEKYSANYQSDGVHISSPSQRDGGYYYAWAVYKNLYLKQVWYPLIPLKTTYDSTNKQITILYNVPDGGILVLDISTISDPGNFGFKVYDASNALLTITGIDRAENGIRLTVSTGTPSYVRYALDGTAGANAGGSTGARGNIRSSVGIPNTEGRVLYHWSWAFQKPVNWTSNLVSSTTLPNPSLNGTWTSILNAGSSFLIAGTVQPKTGISGITNIWGGDAKANGSIFYITADNTNVYAVDVAANTASTFATSVGVNVEDCILNAAETDLYILGDTKIRKINVTTKVVTDVITGLTSAKRGCFNAAETLIYCMDSSAGNIMRCDIAANTVTNLGILATARNLVLSQDEQTLYILHDSSGIYSMPVTGGTPTLYQSGVSGWGICREPGTGHLLVARVNANDIVRVTVPTPTVTSLATVTGPIVVRAKGVGSNSFIMSAALTNVNTYKIV